MILLLGKAGNGIRTRDIKLGKLALYQLSYARNVPRQLILKQPAFVNGKLDPHTVERTFSSFPVPTNPALSKVERLSAQQEISISAYEALTFS